MNCCNDMTGQCDDGPGCPAHRTAEPPARSTAAPAAPGSPVLDDEWLSDVFFVAVFWAMATASAAISVGGIGYLYASWVGA